MNRFLYFKVIFIFFLFGLTVCGFADTDILSTFEIEGADFTYDIETGNIISSGVLVLKSKDFYIEIENVIFDTEKQILKGEGKVKMKMGEINIEGVGIDIDFKKGVASIQKNVKVWGVEKEDKWKIEGETLVVDFIFKEDVKKIKDLYVKNKSYFFYNNLNGGAESIKYFPSEKKVFLEGNVNIKKDKNTIIADNVIINLKTNKVVTKGKVKIIVNK